MCIWCHKLSHSSERCPNRRKGQMQPPELELLAGHARADILKASEKRRRVESIFGKMPRVRPSNGDAPSSVEFTRRLDSNTIVKPRLKDAVYRQLLEDYRNDPLGTVRKVEADASKREFIEEIRKLSGGCLYIPLYVDYYTVEAADKKDADSSEKLPQDLSLAEKRMQRFLSDYKPPPTPKPEESDHRQSMSVVRESPRLQSPSLRIQPSPLQQPKSKFEDSPAMSPLTLSGSEDIGDDVWVAKPQAKKKRNSDTSISTSSTIFTGLSTTRVDRTSPFSIADIAWDEESDCPMFYQGTPLGDFASPRILPMREVRSLSASSSSAPSDDSSFALPAALSSSALSQQSGSLDYLDYSDSYLNEVGLDMSLFSQDEERPSRSQLRRDTPAAPAFRRSPPKARPTQQPIVAVQSPPESPDEEEEDRLPTLTQLMQAGYRFPDEALKNRDVTKLLPHLASNKIEATRRALDSGAPLLKCSKKLHKLGLINLPEVAKAHPKPWPRLR